MLPWLHIWVARKQRRCLSIESLKNSVGIESQSEDPSWIHTYFAKEAACLTQQWMFTNWIKWMQTFILVVVLLILLSTLDRNDVAKHTSWISLSQGHKDTRLIGESARECSSDTWLIYYWLLWHCKPIQISPMCQQLQHHWKVSFFKHGCWTSVSCCAVLSAFGFDKATPLKGIRSS